jgi:hypothetical protein
VVDGYFVNTRESSPFLAIEIQTCEAQQFLGD